jgi:hypothetical protein
VPKAYPKHSLRSWGRPWRSQTKRSFGLIEVIVKVACDPSLFKTPDCSRSRGFFLVRKKVNRVGALQPACLAMRDESLKLIMEHVGGDLIPDNA